MTKAFYSFICEPYDHRIIRGVVYDVIYDNKTGHAHLYFEGDYISWFSIAYFEKRFTTIAELRDKRINEILED